MFEDMASPRGRGRLSARSDHASDPEADELQPVAVGEYFSHLLDIQLGSTVNILRRCTILLGHNPVGRPYSVNAQRTAKHEPAHPEPASRFQQVEAAHDVDLGCPQWVALCCGWQNGREMNDAADPLRFKSVEQFFTIADVAENLLT